jgi:hypothetical protein
MAARAQNIASAVLGALDAGRQRKPFTSVYHDFSTRDAYGVTVELRRLP